MPQKSKPKQNEKLFREFTLTRENRNESIDEEARTVEVSFSSEEPYLRYFGFEILDHSEGAVDLSRLADGGAVLVGHNHNDQVGVVESVRVDKDRVGRSVLRFGKSQRAEEIFQDIRDGIRSKISVGYSVKSMVLEKDEEGQEPVYRVNQWQPFEISLVSVPADQTVGVGRSEETKQTNQVKVNKMPEEIKDQPKVEVKFNAEAERASVQRNELARINAIESVGEKFDCREYARDAIKEGISLEEFNAKVLERMDSPHIKPAEVGADVGLSDKEARQFSFVKAVNALANPTNKQMQEAAAFEFECSRAASDILGKQAQGVIVPMDVLTRDLQVGTAAEAGNLVATELQDQNFIDLLRNRSSVMDLVTVIDGLIGNLALPKQTGGASVYWVGEGGVPTASQLATGQVTLTPHTMGAYTDMTRKALLQTTPAIESLVRMDLINAMALEFDRVLLNGSGSGDEPEGVANMSGIGSVAIGTNGGPITWAKAVELETGVNVNNADSDSMAYITNSKVVGDLKTIEKASSTARFLMENGELNGYQVRRSNQIPSNLTKGTASGVCSQMFFGNFASIIAGMWSGLDLTVDDKALATAGGLRIIALQDMDIGARNVEAFSLVADLTTNA